MAIGSGISSVTAWRRTSAPPPMAAMALPSPRKPPSLMNTAQMMGATSSGMRKNSNMRKLCSTWNTPCNVSLGETSTMGMPALSQSREKDIVACSTMPHISAIAHAASRE
jgi:hypothetical protein